jgi:DNA-binding response OmpR family regulator
LTVIGLERQHRRGPVALNWLGFCGSKGLASRRGRPLNLGELLTAIWGLVFGPGAKIVDVCVRRVRRQRASIR